ncbi:hypothetical protein GGD65_006519 [Bradyrhizobium sp. CIR18]|uniref:hypothetical protein n=1 Tax=Bradyrhizobium sp. CIR18 TaxID=2663839 RepID=UPI0016060DA2|nr:hypothetical protein [Bradyrhizobium sp. CIR18]MBB4365453.1 hypothetical protein [Bradyrhizobium sp. CIR18]
MTELALHGIATSRRTKAESVTHVSGTFCHLCLGPLSKQSLRKAVAPKPAGRRRARRLLWFSKPGRTFFKVSAPTRQHLLGRDADAILYR